MNDAGSADENEAYPGLKQLAIPEGLGGAGRPDHHRPAEADSPRTLNRRRVVEVALRPDHHFDAIAFSSAVRTARWTGAGTSPPGRRRQSAAAS